MNFKEIPNLLGYYFVDKQGNIYSRFPLGRYRKSKYSKILRKLKLQKDKQGYLYIRLYKNKKSKSYLVHRLILETFIGPCPEGMEACHNDGNKENNSLDNLRWDTRSNNHKDKIKHGTHFFIDSKGQNNGNAKLNELQVRIIKKLLKLETLTQTEIGNVFDVSNYAVCDINRGKRWNFL